MRKKLSLLVLLFVFTFFMSGSAYAVNVGNGTELDIEFNNITTSGTLTITTDTIVAVSSLTAAGKEVVFEGFQPGGTTIDLGNIYTFLNIETSTMTLNNISVTKSSGSAVVSSASYISASSSGTFDNNISYVSGGAFVLQNTSTAAFSGDFDFTNNTASTSGGAIYATNSFLDFTNANETNFTGNSAQGINWLNGGGAMFLANSTASFAGDSDFTNNTTSTSGGAIYANNSFLDFTNANETNFSGNTCGLGAGAIFLYGKSTATFSGKVNFSNNTGNTVNSRGGAVYVWSNSHLDFTNASSTTFNSNQAYGGGALYLWTNSTVIFGADTSFINNYASGASGDDSGGGAIHLDYAYMEAQDIKFINNKAANRGGALFLFDDSEAVFKGDTLFENNASAGAGGAIYIQGEYSKLHFTDTSSVTFRSNISVKDSGGALAVYSSTAIFDGAVDFIGNKSGKSGGALYSNAGETVFKGDTLFENNVSTGAGGAIYAESGSKLHFTDTSSVTFRSNTSVNNGGALAVHSSTAIFDGDVAFIDNKSGSSNSGGAIHAGLYSFLDFTNANKTTFTGNRSGTGMFVGGGAMYMAAYSTAVFGGEVNFLNNNNGNTSNVFGGAVFVSPLSYLDFTKASTTIFDSNQAYRGGALYIMNTSTAIFGAETVFRNNYASGAGGAIFNDFAYIIASEAENIKFIGNESSNNGGALYSNEGESIFKGNTLFENNASTGAGGAIYIGNNSKLHFTDTGSVTFSSNTSYTSDGGALAVYSSTAIFDGAVDFIGNKTLNSNYSKGGALYLEDSDASFTSDVLFKDNESAMETMPFDGGQGGGFAAVSTDARNVTFSSAAVFDGNKAGWGGGFYLQNVGVTFADKVLFSSNTTNGFGGGFYAENSWGNIKQDINFNSYAEFRGNKAYAGGGFVVNGNNVMQMSFEDALFVENSAIFAGGAFEAFDIVFDFNGIVRFSSNTSDGHAGAIYTTDSSIGFNGHTVFEYNEAKDGSGGAVDISTADVKFNNNVYFSSNTASDSGGAINITDQGSVFFDIGYAEFFRNKAGNFGGAINTFDSSVHSSTNSKILFNENAADMGGAIFASVGEFQLTNPHFYNNTASTFGGAIASSGTSVSSYAVVNILSLDRGGNDNKTVFRGNEAAGQNNAIYLSDFSSMTFNTGLNASVEMYDKISAQSSTSYLIISGDGKFNMAADADIENLYINNGNFYLRGGRTLNVTNMNISDGSVFNMADHTALDSSTSTTFNTLNVTTFNIDGKLAVDGVNNDGAVNITAGTVNLGETSSLDVLTNITNINYKKKIYKVFYYGILNSSFSAVTINDGLDVDDLSVKNYFKREGNWLLYILEGKGTSTAFTSLAGLSYNSMQVAKLFDSVTTESGRINATEDFLNDIFMLDSQSDNVKKQGLSDMSGYFIANVIRSAGLMSDNGEVYDRIKYQDFKTIDMDGIWVQARGQYNKISSNDNSPEDYKDTMTGFTAGWDKMHDEFGLLIGVFGKYNNNTIEQSAENSADVQGFGAGVYSGLVRDEWELKALISGNFDTFETHRKIRYLDRTADGKFDAFTFGFDVEFGVKTYVTESIYFKPFGGIETKAVSYNGFKEENAAGVGLDIKGDIYTRGLGRIGLIVASDDDQKFEWNAGLQGKYLFVGDEPEIESQFLGSAIKFSSRGAKEGNTLLGVSGGVSYKVIENIKLYANAGYYTSDSYQNFYGQVGIRYMFLQNKNRFEIKVEK